MMTQEINSTNQSINNLQVHLTTIISNVSPLSSTISTKFSIGISLALLSSLFIGSSFILKKKGLLRSTNYNGAVRAGSGGFGYLCEIQWWIGVGTMGLGEFCNFVAYGFAPASVVTPLGALSVLVTTLLADRFLNETLNILGKIGCLLTIFGSIIIVIHAPKDSDLNSLDDFSRRLTAAEFLLFSLITCIIIISFIIYCGPRYGAKHVCIYILICSLLGAFTVTACKGLGAGIKEILTRVHTHSIWLTFACLIIILICVPVQMVYLNKALDLFTTPVVTTVYYVLFTTCVLVTSGILFREWHVLTIVDIFACLIGFSVTTCGLILINYSKASIQINNKQCDDVNDEFFLPYFDSNSQQSLIGSSDSTSGSLVKQQQNLSGKAYSNFLYEDGKSSLTTNSTCEQRQPMLSSDNCDLSS